MSIRVPWLPKFVSDLRDLDIATNALTRFEGNKDYSNRYPSPLIGGDNFYWRCRSVNACQSQSGRQQRLAWTWDETKWRVAKRKGEWTSSLALAAGMCLSSSQKFLVGDHWYLTAAGSAHLVRCRSGTVTHDSDCQFKLFSICRSGHLIGTSEDLSDMIALYGHQHSEEGQTVIIKASDNSG